MTWPIFFSVPHMGVNCPDELLSYCTLTADQIIKDSDEDANEIYSPLKKHVRAFFHSPIARAFVDLNRSGDDFSSDGVFKTQTCWQEPIYKKNVPDELICTILKKYYHPYHALLSHAKELNARLAIDCHTMSALAPPIATIPGQKRPDICISMIDHSCPMQWVVRLAELCKEHFNDVRINDPFKGGYITAAHGKEMPWLQLEFSRSTENQTTALKSELLFKILNRFVTELID